MVVSTPKTEIPHGLELVIAFVNTLDPDEPPDAFASPEGVRAWLVERGLLPASSPVLTERERERAVRLREALRELMLEHSGAGSDAEGACEQACEELDEVARAGDLAVRFTGTGSARLATGTEGFEAALARILVPVAEADYDGTWQRVKACRADDCQWAFYDRSRNRSGVWCDMAVCGNREKVRAYRRRR
jgi:predicted RNA-binding Zn ribbon-like protein